MPLVAPNPVPAPRVTPRNIFALHRHRVRCHPWALGRGVKSDFQQPAKPSRRAPKDRSY